MQNRWLTQDEREKLVDVRDFQFLVSLLEKQDRGEAPVLDGSNGSSDKNPRYSLPYLTARTMAFWHIFEDDELYHDLRRWMRFDLACCDQLPVDDEIVFHHRKFMAEMPRHSQGNRFTEVSPATTANLVFANRTATANNNTTTTPENKNTSSRVAIVSRLEAGLPNYLEALKSKGIEARYIAGQSGVQDFCFAMHARTELVGKEKSTFFRWAALLGNATLNRLYSLDQNCKSRDAPEATTTAAHPHTVNAVRRRGNRLFVSETYWQPYVRQPDAKAKQ